jgi:hypothetical protein
MAAAALRPGSSTGCSGDERFCSRRGAETQRGRASATVSPFSSSLREIKEQMDSRFRGGDEKCLRRSDSPA